MKRRDFIKALAALPFGGAILGKLAEPDSEPIVFEDKIGDLRYAETGQLVTSSFIAGSDVDAGMLICIDERGKAVPCKHEDDSAHYTALNDAGRGEVVSTYLTAPVYNTTEWRPYVEPG